MLTREDFDKRDFYLLGWFRFTVLLKWETHVERREPMEGKDKTTGKKKE